jgi:two-component system nitrogen regulation response regulator NtrX
MADKKKPLVLIIDDEKSICETLSGLLDDEGWESVTSLSGKEGLELFKKYQIDLVFLDVWMNHLDGIQTLQEMKRFKDEVPIIIMSGHATIETAVKATKLGAYDFLEKPLSVEKILPILEHAKKIRVLQVRTAMCFSEKSYELIGISDEIASIHRQIKNIARRNSWVLISGENGTGKEVVARNIHLQSSRAEKNFVAVNCAAIPEELIESELFGFAKGAFTHATYTKMGKFELAHRGTLFLDEIGDMSLKTQAKILRILQEQSLERLGENTPIPIDVRVIAATNKNIPEEIKKGNFREDLYYRLNVIPLKMPPLRERPVDIKILSDYFLEKIVAEFNEEMKRIDPVALQLMMKYSWPGNVRELKNVLERLCLMVSETLICETHINEVLSEEVVNSESSGSIYYETLKEARNNFERSFIVSKLEDNEWNISKTAETIGLERSHLHRKMKNFEIEPQRRK